MANPIKKCVLHGAVNNETVDLYPRTNLASVSDMTAFARTLNGAADAAAARNTLGIANYTHPNSGVVAGTYRKVTVNAQGHVTQGENPILAISEGGTGATTIRDVIQTLFGKAGIGTNKIPLYYDGTTLKACDDAVDTGSIIAASLQQNGWIKFSNGLVVQWGMMKNTSYEDAYPFPIALSNVFAILGERYGADDNTADISCVTYTKHSMQCNMNGNGNWWFLIIGVI